MGRRGDDSPAIDRESDGLEASGDRRQRPRRPRRHRPVLRRPHSLSHFHLQRAREAIANNQATSGVAVQPDGKIVVLGTQIAADGTGKYAFHRLNPDGSLDPTVRIQVFDMRGRLVRTLLQRILPAGRHQVGWDGKDQQGQAVSSGIYVFHLVTADVTQTRKAVLVR